MTEAEQAFYGTIQYQNSLRPNVGPMWQCRDYRQIERFRQGLAMRLEQIQDKLKELGIEKPLGTLRRWASEGLVPSPNKYQNPNGRGQLSDWPEEFIWEAAAVEVIKKYKFKWSKSTPEAIKEARRIAKEIVSKIENPKYTLPASSGSDSSGQEGYFIHSKELQELILMWIITVEKVKQGWPIEKPAKVRFITTGKNKNGVGEVKYRGVHLEESTTNSFHQSFLSPEDYSKLY